MKFVHNCIHFLCIFFSVICKAYLIKIVLIAIINSWVFKCVECNEIAKLGLENEAN